MVKIFFIIVTSSFLQSCCYSGLRNEYGIPRKNINFKTSLNDDIYLKIDTSCIYERIGYFNKANIYYENIDIKVRQGLKFYKDGKIGQFSFDNNNTVKGDFDPKKAIMGFYHSQNNNIYIKQFGINQCKSWIFTSEILTKSDSIILKSNTSDYNFVYVKKKLSKEFLIYKPDW